MTGTIVGTETEYAVVGYDRSGEVVPAAAVAGILLKVARTAFPSVRGPGGLFLANGGRFYIDVGHHPEWATPETTDPLDTVRYTLAGDRLLGFLARLATLGSSLARLDIFRAGAGYSSWWHSTWGQHENYLVDMPPRALEPYVTAHLASRVVFSGEGGLVPGDRGLRFVLSSRILRLLQRELHPDDPATLSFVAEKESLVTRDRRWFRLHVALGAPLLSHLALWLKVGTTALVIRAAEHGLLASEDLRLVEPVTALLRFASDPDLVARARVASGECLTAVELQWRIVSRISRYARERFMPPWAPRLCAAWKRVLSLLGGRDPGIHRCLDWAIRRRILAEARRLSPPASRERGLGMPLREREGSAAAATHLDPRFKAIQAADLRFGQVGRRGIFEQLDARGFLSHALVDESSIARAMREPPAETRAAVRGQAVRRLDALGSEAFAWWHRLIDVGRNRIMELPDPWSNKARWLPFEESSERTLDYLPRLRRTDVLPY